MGSNRRLIGMLIALAGTTAGIGAHAQARCAGGRVSTPLSQGYCCWPGQRWSEQHGRCSGPPDCPPGMAGEGETCVPDPNARVPAQPPPAQPPPPQQPVAQPPPPARPPPPSQPRYEVPTATTNPAPVAPVAQPAQPQYVVPTANAAPPPYTPAAPITPQPSVSTDTTGAPMYVVPPADPNVQPRYVSGGDSDDSGGRDDSQPYDGGVVPPGMRVETRMRRGLLAGGIVLFGVGYLTAAITGLVTVGSGDICTRPVGWALFPLLGPIIAPAAVTGTRDRYLTANGTYVYFGCSNAGGWWAAGVTDFIVQVTGFSLMLAGARSQRVLVHAFGGTRERPLVQLAVVPAAPGASVGLSLVGATF